MFLCSIHCSRDSAQWKLPGTTQWLSRVPMMHWYWYFCIFGRHTPILTLACNWKCVVRWGKRILILLVSCLPYIVGSLAYMFVGWSRPAGLMQTSFPLHIKRTWSALLMFLSLALPIVFSSFLVVLIHIVFCSLLFFLCRRLIFHYQGYVSFSWCRITSLCWLRSGSCL